MNARLPRAFFITVVYFMHKAGQTEIQTQALSASIEQPTSHMTDLVRSRKDEHEATVQ